MYSQYYVATNTLRQLLAGLLRQVILKSAEYLFRPAAIQLVK